MSSYNWITIICGTSLIHFGSEAFPPPHPSHPPLATSNQIIQHNIVVWGTGGVTPLLKTVKPYYGNRYQISLSNRFCHPMKNCWQQGSVWVTIWNTVLDLNDQTHISYDMNGSVDKKCEEESMLCYYGSSLCLCHWVSWGSQFPERHSSSTWGGERKIEIQSLPQC